MGLILRVAEMKSKEGGAILTDWKKDISSVFINNEARRVEINNPLNDLLNELKSEEGIHQASFELVNEFPLIWNVQINGKEAQIVEADVALAQRLYDEPYDKTFSDPKRDVTEVLKEILVVKFK